jgi:ribosomal protein L35AE/L33A
MSARTHGMSGTRLYDIWKNMKGRCYRKSSTHYHRYGGRGIIVCDEWKNSFENFMKFAFDNGYTDELTIDRIDNDKNYEPSNVRFVSNAENVGAANRIHRSNGTGGQSKTTFEKIKKSNRSNHGTKVVLYNDHETINCFSIGEAAEYLSKQLCIEFKNVYSHAKQVVKGKCKTIHGWRIKKCAQ